MTKPKTSTTSTPAQKAKSAPTASQFVDLGLSVKWATCNLGASSPEQYGNYYAWGETRPRTGSSFDYKWSTAPYYQSGGGYDNVKYSKYKGSDGKHTLSPTDDAATVSLGSPWRMPTNAEVKELVDKCTWTPTTINGVRGQKAVGSNGNSIFFPFAGERKGTALINAGVGGGCWANYVSDGIRAAYLQFQSGGHSLSFNGRFWGMSIRPVRP